MVFGNIDDSLRARLLEEEFRLRRKQPPAWTMQKYRKYANFGVSKAKRKA
ncbi:MAG: hypothetical protein NTW59_04035 [Candidatus Diapherotrites archaeon]|nr:hypothetical protein [Candidatus Diapherotrites archaeon]